MERITGTILRYYAARGFGFISDGAEQHFFHIKECEDRNIIFNDGDIVSFVIGISKKTELPEAQQVRLEARAKNTFSAASVAETVAKDGR